MGDSQPQPEAITVTASTPTPSTESIVTAPAPTVTEPVKPEANTSSSGIASTDPTKLLSPETEDDLADFDGSLKFDTKRRKAKDKFASNRHRALGDSVFTVGKGGGAQTNPVALPPGEELDGWLAFNAKEIFDQCKSLFGFFSDKCTCPSMTAGEQYEYLWKDDTMTDPVKLPAKQYVELLLKWADPKIHVPDEKIQGLDGIMRRLFRVYAHIYCHHKDTMLEHSIEPHFKKCLKHFVLLAKEFKLVNDDDFTPMKDYINAL